MLKNRKTRAVVLIMCAVIALMLYSTPNVFPELPRQPFLFAIVFAVLVSWWIYLRTKEPTQDSESRPRIVRRWRIRGAATVFAAIAVAALSRSWLREGDGNERWSLVVMLAAYAGVALHLYIIEQRLWRRLRRAKQSGEHLCGKCASSTTGTTCEKCGAEITPEEWESYAPFMTLRCL